MGAEKLWKLMRSEPFVPALGALTGNQAMQQIRAGLKAVYCSGWQVSIFPSEIVQDHQDGLCLILRKAPGTRMGLLLR